MEKSKSLNRLLQKASEILNSARTGLWPFGLLEEAKILPVWKDLFLSRQRKSLFLAYLIYAFGQFIHIVAVDRPLGLHNESPFWMGYRLILASSGSLIAAWLAIRPRLGWYEHRFLIGCTMLFFTVTQSVSMRYSVKIPVFYTFFLPLVMSSVAGLSALEALIFTVGALASSWFVIPNGAVEPGLYISGCTVCLGFVIVLRSSLRLEIDAFRSDWEKREAEKKVIQVQQELERELRSFLPREILRRIDLMQAKAPGNVRLALDAVLEPRLRKVAVLHSDLRGFTQQVKLGGRFIQEALIPSLQDYIDIVELKKGIPRQVGDLLFAYFEDEEELSGIEDAIGTAMKVITRMQTINAEVDPAFRMRRYVIISYGEAVVGNVGGRNGAREISAVGSCANILSRIDPLTKAPEIARSLHDGSLILTSKAREAAERSPLCKKILEAGEMKTAHLADLGLSIRDFPEENTLSFWKLGEVANVSSMNRRVA